VPTVPVWSRDKGAAIDYCVVEELAAVLWAVNIGSLELHTSLHLGADLHRPTVLAFEPLRSPVTYAETKPLARAVAEGLEAQSPDEIVSRMKRSLRAGKVLIDWGQNTEHKSMVCVYSVRVKARPTVSTPLTWAEVAGARSPDELAFEPADVLRRVDEHGDLFAGVLL
jgi:bifunctional non-homologous end joining protein LigD